MPREFIEWNKLPQRGRVIFTSIGSTRSEVALVAETAFDGTYVDLSWSTPAITAYRSGSFYRLERNTQFLATIALGVEAYQDTGLSPGSDYTYTLYLIY